MTSKKTRHALVSSIISLVLCCSMLIGTTFAWFTDEVASTGNIIKSGTLDIELWFGETQQTMVNIEEATEKAIFNYQYWEPGYVDMKYIQLKNVGDLAFKYQMRVVPENAVADGMKLAEVIDVYAAVVGDNFTAPTRDTVENMTKLGTLQELMVQAEGVDNGVLLPAEGKGSDDVVTPTVEYYTGDVTVCLALKMQEEAGNEYQKLSIGDGFDVQVLATQFTYENDSFDHLYDEWANGDSLTAKVTGLGTKNIMATWGMGGQAYPMELTPAFQFEPTETHEESQKSPYRYYHADFVVSADKDVAAEALALAGYYRAFCDGFNNGHWVALKADDVIPAGTEIRLVDTMGGGDGSGNGGIYVNYEELCRYGNDGIGFRCGASAQDASVIGTTLTVELRLYETTGDPSDTTGSKNIETGKFMTIATYKHTFGIDTASNLQSALSNGGTVVLTGDMTLDIKNATNLSTITKETVIDLDGNTLTVEIPEDANIGNQALFTVKAGGELTIKNGTIELSYGDNANQLTAIVSNEGGNVVIEGGNFKVTRSGANGALIAAIVDNNSTLGASTVTIKGGTFCSDSAIVRNFVNGHDATIIINGGDFQDGYIWNQKPSANAQGQGYITINGGTFDAENVIVYNAAYPGNLQVAPSVTVTVSDAF